MPAAALISGYAWMRLARRAGHHPASLMPPGALDRMTDLCSGWRAGGAAVTSVVAGHGVPVQDCPPAPGSTADDPWAWHGIGPLEADWMRRRRCMDVTVDADGAFRVWAMFRDTVGEGDGAELVLHEYAVRAAGAGTVLHAVEAEPRVLPFAECPGAAHAVGSLAGAELGALATVGARHLDRYRLVHAPERPAARARRGGGPGRRGPGGLNAAARRAAPGRGAGRLVPEG